ncbi:MAG TPA: formylglycine-generating enzyme family protein [Gemmataceae bacterium]|nr:formylglycine-generating enzyme family protein [Gemmataceae bacterium]
MTGKSRIPTFVAILLLGMFSGLSCEKPGVSSAPADTPPTITTKGGAEMVLIPAGSFEMGSRHGKEDEAAAHRVNIDAFLMDKYEVTQADYEKLGIPCPSHFKGPTLPAEQVTWVQAASYCNARSRAEDLQPCYNEETGACDFHADGYRLPTEAEWEYACRAGTSTDYSFGSDSRNLGAYAWFADNASKTTHPAGQKKPNPWGLFDMYGNVAEWCNDAYDKDYYKNSPAANPQGPADGKEYVLRGGSWKSSADALRSAYRLSENPGFSDACLARDAIGFRCVRKAPATPPVK